jgi:DNA-binding SARP family transcriptional activator
VTGPQLQTLGDVVLRGPGGEELSRRRMYLALLAVVASRAPAEVGLEELQTLFWRAKPADPARHALHEALRWLRETCGDAVEVRAESVRLDPRALDVDARRFAAAARAKDWRAAVACWTGEYLPRCEDLGIEEFRRWLDGERERLRRTLAACLERAVADATRGGDADGALALATRWAASFPLDERASRALVEASCGAGRADDAARARDAFVRRLSDLLDERPSAAWRKATAAAIAAAVERERVQESERPGGEVRLPVTAVDAPRPRRAADRRWLAAAGVAAVLAAALLLAG